ncbi:HEAT repeat domain-containing protein [Amycolatopsis sp. cg9]|uniref:HEAT repeat domain-containing protein n=1 Tax=Amycolatopsis sp. cg9 TaxID=3238801 RepID=UPI003524A7DF
MPETNSGLFAERVAAREKHLPRHWAEAHLLEHGADGSTEGRMTFDSFVVHVRDAGEITWVVHGPAGSGKTTVLRALEIALLRAEVPVLFVNASMLRRAPITKGMDAVDFVRQSRPPGIPEKLWKSRVKHRKVVVLLDGVNEIRREFPTGREARLITQLAGGNHGLAVVLTSRQADESIGEFRSIRRLRLQDLTQEQVRAYLADHGLDPDRHLAWLRKIGLAGLSSNPLLLEALVTHVSRHTTDDVRDPNSRAELVRNAAHRHMAPDRVPPKVSHHIESGMSVDSVWSACAVLSHFGESGEFTRHEVLQILGKCLPAESATDFLDFFLNAGPIDSDVQVSAVTARSYSLSHQRYAECGLALGWGPRTPPPIASSGEFFGGFIADWCALQPDPARATAMIVKAAAAEFRFETVCDLVVANAPLMDEETKNEAWRALGRGLTMSRARRTRLADELGSLPRATAVEGISRGLLDGLAADDTEVWALVRDALITGTLDGRQLQKYFRQADRRRSIEGELANPRRSKTTSPEPARTTGAAVVQEHVSEREEVRPPGADRAPGDKGTGVPTSSLAPDVATAGGASDVGDAVHFAELTTDRLIRMLVDDEKHVRVQAAIQLNGRPDVDSPVLAAFEDLDDIDSTIRMLSALGRIGSPVFIPTLANFLDDADVVVRGKALTALGRIGSPAAAEKIRPKLLDADGGARGAAVTALGRCGNVQDVHRIVTVMSDQDTITQFSAIGAMFRFFNYRGPGETREEFPAEDVALAVAALDGAEPGSLVAFCSMIQKTAVPNREAILDRLTRHSVAKVRGAALTALGSVHPELGADRARAMLDDRDDVNRAAAITVIYRSGAADAELLRGFLYDPASCVRGTTSQAVGRLGDLVSLDRVIELLRDVDPIVRGSAATACALLNGVQAVPILVQMLDDPMDNVRGSAAKALGLLGAPEAIDPLCRSLADCVPYVRGTAAAALAVLADPAATSALIPVAADPDAGVRRAAVGALGRIGDLTGLPSIIEAMHDEDAAVRWNAATAAGRIGDPSVCDILVPLLEDEDSHVRGATATALGWLGQESSVAPLMNSAKDSVARVRGSVATALGRIGDPRSVPVLVALAIDKDDVVRSSAVTAVGRGGFTSAMDLVRAALIDDSPEVRGGAVRAMARLSPTSDLREVLADRDPRVRRAAIAAIGDSSGTDDGMLLHALNDDDEEVRLVAVVALGRRHSAGAVAYLQQALDDPSEAVGSMAVQSLGQVVDEADRTVLIQALRSSRRAVRLAAADVLGVDAGPGTRSALEDLLRHPDGRSRAAGAQALGRIGDALSEPALIEALRDPDSYVRGFAAAALARTSVGSENARTALLGRLGDPVEAVVGMAARALGALGGENVADALRRCASDSDVSLWTRATAVQAVAPLFHRPQEWLRVLADQFTGSSPRSGAAKFRGATIAAVIRGPWDDDVCRWTTGILLEDRDPINQTAAAAVLAKHGRLPVELAARFLSNLEDAGRLRRSDTIPERLTGDAAAAAVLRGVTASSASDPAGVANASAFVAGALNRTASSSMVSSALSALDALDSAAARSFLDDLTKSLTSDTRTRFATLIDRAAERLTERTAEEESYRRLSRTPERFLEAFMRSNSEGEDATPAMSCDIGLITIIGEESRAVIEWLEEHDPSAEKRGPGGVRFVYRADVPAGSGRSRIVMTQAIEQNQTSASNAADYLVEHFSPRFLILLGVAGGIHADVTLGDVVIGTHVIDYGPAASTSNGPRHRGSAFRPPVRVVAALNNYFARHGEPRQLTAHHESAELGRSLFALQRGPIGTGPRVVKFKDAEERTFLSNYNEKTLALETEAEAVARHFYEQGDDGTITGYMVLRAISDHADEEKDDRWKLAASRNAVAALKELLPVIVEAL